jgi:hypothetical protein
MDLSEYLATALLNAVENFLNLEFCTHCPIWLNWIVAIGFIYCNNPVSSS